MKPARALIRFRAKARRFLARDALPAAKQGILVAREVADQAGNALLGRDFEGRLRRLPVRAESIGERGLCLAPGSRQLDPFGFDLGTAKYAVALAALFHRVYFRSEVHGIDRVPPGRVLLIANHSGQLPIDAMLIGASMFFDAEPPRMVRSMVEKWTQTLPFVGTLFQRLGQVVGVPENAKRLLDQGEAVLVFPEGARGASKPFRQRYRLTDFGLGFMRLALETETPIVPIAVVGGEEQYINLGNFERLAKLLDVPVFPIIPQWFIPGAQWPLPVRYRIYFGEPLQFDGDPDDEDAVIEEKVGVVKSAINQMIARGLRERPGIFR